MNTKQTIDQVIINIAAHKWAFALVFFVVFTLSYAVLYALDWLPEPVTEEATSAMMAEQAEAASTADSDTAVVTAATTTAIETPVESPNSASTVAAVPQSVLPHSIAIDRLDKTITVKNPTSRAIADLDNALLGGVVRHPDSATLDDDGNIFILGHSSYLPNVLNRNFQAFNGIQNLAWGDTIRLISDDAEYVYRVEKVYQAKASALTVPVAGTGKMLTLATCNSFGSTDDRYIVEAKLIDTRSL